MISKLPDTGTTIFTVMSEMAQKHNAINLSQGFPDFDVSQELIKLVNDYMLAGKNQYAPMPGLPKLREAISAKIRNQYQNNVDPDTEITITSGATEANYCVITALVHAGDEVIIFEPAYDSYEPVIRLCGGIVRRIQLHYPDYSIPWETVEEVINEKTKLIIINSPHNPTGAITNSEDLRALEVYAKKHDLFILSDEVYEHIIFDGQTHESVLRYPGLKERSVAVFSFGKTFHATGWKVGYCVASDAITREIRKVHQFLNFSVNTPVQWALAAFLECEENYLSVSGVYQDKRDLFLKLTEGSSFEPIPTYGTYFQLMNYSKISDLGDVEMAEYLTKEKGIASIPISVFYNDRHDDQVLRFCFAKTEETLEEASRILCRI